jgi:1-acyl-sn-glycerol-3-phosphate acyltransferase
MVRGEQGAAASGPVSPPESGEIAAAMRPLVDTIDAAMKAHLREEPFQRDPRLVQLALPLIKAVNRYFGVEVRGWENLPAAGAMLIVGNHSGGAQTVDVAPLLEQWIRNRGAVAPLYMLGYDLLFAVPVLTSLWRKLGLLRADPGMARAALERGAAVVVFPGGDYEVFRSWSERNTIAFGGHAGFVELALAARVPVVPMTIHGAHQSTLVLTRGQGIARWMGLERLHIKVFPFIWNIPFGVTPAFVPSLQLPAKVTVQFGKPLDWSRFRPEEAADRRVVRRCYAEITELMQHTLDALAREHPHPILSRLNELRPSRILRRLVGRSASGGQSRSPAPHTEPRRRPRRHRAANKAVGSPRQRRVVSRRPEAGGRAGKSARLSEVPRSLALDRLPRATEGQRARRLVPPAMLPVADLAAPFTTGEAPSAPAGGA